MNTESESVDEALESAENALRDFIQEVLEKEFGEEWLEKCGIPEKRIKQWEKWRDAEKKKDISSIVEDRILYYSDFSDLRSIINRHWRLFKPCFKDKNRILSRLKELKGFRDTVAHRRELLAPQRQVIHGYCGTIRRAITVYRSKQTPEGEYFPRIEYAKDSLGNVVRGSTIKENKRNILKPGDEVEYVIKAWDPLDEPLEYSYSANLTSGNRWSQDEKGDYVYRPELFGKVPDGRELGEGIWISSNRAIWIVRDEHIGASCGVFIYIRSKRKHHADRSTGTDDMVSFFYKVLPEEPPKKKS